MKIPFQKPTKIILAVSAVLFAVLLCASAVLGGMRRQLAVSLPSELAAARWGDGCAMVSVFFAADDPHSARSVFSTERSVDRALTAASLTAPEGARLWYQAYGTEIAASVSTERARLPVTVTVVGGDWFAIHRPPLESGAYLADTAAGDGAIFLDADAAFALFGAVDVVGGTVYLGEHIYTVCGVGAAERNELYDGYGDTPRVYITYTSPYGRGVTDITAWQAVLPEPIDGFAVGVAEDVFSAYEGTAVIVENSERFSLSALYEMIGARETLGVRTSAITYPWWENTARVTQYRASGYLLAETVLLILCALVLLFWIVLFYRPVKRVILRFCRTVRDKIENAWEWLTIPQSRHTRPKKEKKPKKPKKAKKEKKEKKEKKPTPMPTEPDASDTENTMEVSAE